MFLGPLKSDIWWSQEIVDNILVTIHTRSSMTSPSCKYIFSVIILCPRLILNVSRRFLRRRLTFSPSIQPIALPTRAQSSNRFLGGTGTIVGWGRTRDSEFMFDKIKKCVKLTFFLLYSDSAALSNQLRFVSLPIVADAVCERVYNNDYRFFTPSNICIDGANGSSCNGDSGSAMHLNSNGRMTVIGVVSYGSATCETGHPVAMTRVTSYLDWISSNTGLRP